MDKLPDRPTTPLRTAILMADEKAVRELLAEGADPNEAEPEGMAPLPLAFAGPRFSPRIVRMLWDAGAVLDLEGERGAEILEAVLVRYPQWPIALDLLLEADRTQPVLQGQWGRILRKAALGEEGAEMAEILRRLGPLDPADLLTALQAARWQGLMSTIGAMVEAGTAQGMELDRPQEHETPVISDLHRAAEEGNAQAIRDLGPSIAVDIRDEAGRTPLIVAIEALCPEVVRLLLDLGADPEVRDIFGRDAHDALAQALADIHFEEFRWRENDRREESYLEIRTELATRTRA